MGGSRNKSKKFLKQKQAKQKRRSPQKVKNAKSNKKQSQNDGVSNSNANRPGLTRDDLASLSNSEIHFHKTGGFDDGSEFSDNISLVSELTIAADECLDVDEQQSAYNELDEHFDNLSEKDAIMRMSALNHINHSLRRRVFDDYLRAKQCDKLYTLSSNLRSCLLRGSTKEQCLALETCALVMLTLQTNHDSFVRQVRPIVLRFMQSPHSRHAQIKAIEVWTCMTWVLGDEKKTLGTIELLDDIWMKRLSQRRLKAKFKEKNAENAELVKDDNDDTNKNSPSRPDYHKQHTYMKDSNADSSDSFSDNDDENDVDNLLDAQTEEKKENDDTNSLADSGSLNAFTQNTNPNKLTESQADLLQAHSRKVMPDGVTIAAINSWIWLISSINDSGAIGSLLEVYHKDFMDILEHNKSIELRCVTGKALTLLISNYKKSVFTPNGKNRKTASNGGFDFDSILSVFDEFVDESDIRRKHALKEQKRIFRDYLRTLENKWTPKITIKLRGQAFELEGWCKWIQYHCLKGILQSGFQPHLLENPTVQGAFDMENVEPPQPLTQLEKKSKLMGHADDARQHKQKIKGQRRQKQAFMFSDSTE